jgi:hypothetical protein
LEQTLADAYIKDDLTEEEIVQKFFRNINMLPEKKDYFIKDFEDFYFKIRPKFSSKLIKILLEGDFKNGIQGLLFLISEVDESAVSACSTLQLVSKLMDFQKNIYADYYIREFAKVEPRVLKRYCLDSFLARDGYKNFAL